MLTPPTETVEFLVDEDELDDLGEVVGTRTEHLRAECVVCPGATSSLGADRPNGFSAAFTLHVPKGFSANLRGARAVVRGEEDAVSGDPQPYAEGSCPGEYCMPVEVGRADG